MEQQPRKARVTPPHKVFFTWEVSYECNYNCVYCHAPKHSRPGTVPTVYPGLDAWIRAWQRMRDDYGECEMVVSGGEPFAYPDFMPLAIEVAKMHIVEFTTNLHFDISPILSGIVPPRARFGTSFHPLSADLNTFLRKVLALRERGFEVWVNFVPWPPLLEKLKEYKETFESHGIKFVVQPFIGQYEERQYPRGYTDDEKKLLGIFTDEANKKAIDFKTTNESNKKGKPCRMGQNYAFIHPDGETDRCCKDKTVKLGNVLNGSFRLLDEPLPCHADECNCWRCMLVEKEPEWVKYWGRNNK